MSVSPGSPPLMEDADQRDLAADFERKINEGIIHDLEVVMPLRLIDTYTGLILKRSEITSLLKRREEYRTRLEDAISETVNPTGTGRPHRSRLLAFILEYLAFAMFSHRWGAREMTISDVRNATQGIYSIVQAPPSLRGELASEFLAGAKKLQEFCCVAAKCGYRWAWSDTCCIDDQVFGEKSESLNSMFLWYHSSDLTVVYLDDVDDVEDGRLPAIGQECWFDDVEIQYPFHPSYPYSSELETSDTVVTLHNRSQEGPSRRLQSFQLDSQVETAHLEDHLGLNFPTVPGCKARGKYRNVPVWVTRGWTLQEMLASRRLRFYSKRWTLLEEAEDRDTDEAEKMISVSSFKSRAQLLDHRLNPIWCTALENTTDVPALDIAKFEAGSRDIRTRLRWAARRSTTKVEDMAYCLLGIFDITLPAMYGEGPRAFFRLQEELMKRTADPSLFDWCGRSSSVNSFLAFEPECYIESDLPVPYIDEWHGSTLRMILDIFRVVLGTITSGYLAAIREVKDKIMHVTRSIVPGHSLVNGELNVSMFEYQVKHCERVESSEAGDSYFHYRVEADGLKSTHVTLRSHMPSLVARPARYYLCRVWSPRTHNVFQILLELIEYAFKEKFNEFWNRSSDSADSDLDFCDVKDDEVDGRDEPESKLRDEMQTKRKRVLEFFEQTFPVFLVRVEDGRRIRMTTVNRVEADYKKFDFNLPVVTRLVL